MMNMGQLHKVAAQLHIIIGPQHISIPFESDAMAKQEFEFTVVMLRQRKPSDWRIIEHAQGSVWIDINSIIGLTWTKEQRVATPLPGLTGPMPMHG